MAGRCDPTSFDDAALTIWDGIVIGAGPAGAMAARQLALAGRRVLLDHVGPPGFAIVISGRIRQYADRIAADRIRVGAGRRLVLDAATGHF